MRCFLGINLMMGLTKKSSYRDYWSSSIQMRDPYISSSMSRDRFDWLLSNIHLNDNTVQPKKGEAGFDKLYKLRPLIDILSKTYLESYKPNEHQSIDESMVKFKGRIGFRQCMPMKPVKRGYKIWIRADQSGFVSQFQVYTGKYDGVQESLGSRVVKDLTRPLVGKYHKVYFDNFFTTIPLLRDLLKENIYACGTIRKNRKEEPKDITNNKDKMLRGTSLWKISKEGIFYLKWMDNKPVLFSSNYHGPDDVQTVSRKQKDGSSQNIACLQLVHDYNAHMGHVDQSDMFLSLYKVNRKSRKWWHRLFWHFLDLSIVNSFIIFRDRSPTKSLNLKDFRLAVAAGLIGADPAIPKKGRKSLEDVPNHYKRSVPPEIKYDKCAHMPIHGTKVRCAHCSSRSEPHRTRWHCSSCNVGLCLTEKSNCFLKFHQKF
ncbi:piggyBac transposable element-derived protein 4 [Leptinotarsa decemlineata]|uniref:piggyBac transposable element-derived protein 4 n=1 Tax=Leptinotarsa decemlineata TaxID=7539 RepID=UPI003D3053BA